MKSIIKNAKQKKKKTRNKKKQRREKGRQKLQCFCFAFKLGFLLSPLVPNDYSCKDNFSFVTQTKNVNLSRKILISYDATSLFANILLQDTMAISIIFSFNHNPNLSITKEELKKLFLFATSQNHLIKSMEQLCFFLWLLFFGSSPG